MDLPLSLFLFLPCSLMAQFTTILPIEEHGVTYNQTMTLNNLTGDILMNVPKHYRDGINFYEVDRIENEDLGIIISKLREESYCMLHKMPETMRPFQTLILGAEVSSNHSTVTLDDMVLNYFWEQCGEEVNTTEIEALTEDMKELCKGIPIIKVTTIKITKEAFEALTKDDKLEGSGESVETTDSGPSDRLVMTRRASCDCCETQMARSLEMTLEHNMYVHVPCRE